ncbi:hypothetical protein [Salinibaculum rarum]|uniref:hypothetical protein n=1 Tax=Salinibaculum rarum TaxID=3058903 RepID=UPI00265E6AAE|nr:hypothetical protein [Salinibaculum sp. KK48]
MPDDDSDTPGDEMESSDGAESLLTRLDSYPLAQGLVGGIASFLGGYVLLFGLLTSVGSVDFDRGASAVLESVGYVFYNVLHVPTYLRLNRTRQVTQRAENGTVVREQELVSITERWQNGVTGTQTIEQRQYIDGELVGNATQSTAVDPGLPVPELLYLAIPVVALLAVGYVYGDRCFDLDEWDPNTVIVQGLLGGVTLTVGYLLVTLGGTFLLVKTGSEGQALLHPARFEALVSGIVYPLVAGTVGVVAGQVSFEDLREQQVEAENAGSDSDRS